MSYCSIRCRCRITIMWETLFSGYKAHMGAGSITSNVKSDKKPVVVKAGPVRIGPALKKFGAMLGDEVEVGCGSV